MANCHLYILRKETVGVDGRVAVRDSEFGLIEQLEREYSVPSGTKLGDFLIQNGYSLPYDCGGRGTCKKCRVWLARRMNYKSEEPDELESVSESVQSDSSKSFFLDSNSAQSNFAEAGTICFDSVLACRVTIEEDLFIVLPKLDSFGTKSIDTEPLYCSTNSPDSRCDPGKFLSLSEKRKKESDRSNCPQILEESLSTSFGPIYFEDFLESAERGAIFDVEKSIGSRRFGLAVDLGSTTIVVSLLELGSGCVLGRCTVRNPQVHYGSDIISRIGYASRGASARQDLREPVFGVLSEMSDLFGDRYGLSNGSIVKIALAGNSVMESLFLDLDPTPMGEYPFRPSQTVFDVCRIEDFPFDSVYFDRSGTIYCFPLFSGFVGGDIVSGLVSLGDVPEIQEPFFFYDIGTNGELVLVQNGHYLVTACAAGPAFEGAGIEFGMTGCSGAIVHVDFTPDPVPIVLAGGPARGICGSGVVDVIAELLRSGVLRADGRFDFRSTNSLSGRLRNYRGQSAFAITERINEERINREEINEERINGNSIEREQVAPTGKITDLKLRQSVTDSILLTQKDIRQVQMATGAIRSGVRALLETSGLSFGDFRHLFIAGNFGSNLRMENARRIGLFPSGIFSDRVKYLGNTSLKGAEALLRDESLEDLVLKVVRRSSHLELSTFPRFSEIFVESMRFPNT